MGTIGITNSSLLKCMWFSGDCNLMCTNWSKTVPLASNNNINGWTEEKEGINVRESRKRGREWNNWKDRGGFGDGWDCSLLTIIVSR